MQDNIKHMGEVHQACMDIYNWYFDKTDKYLQVCRLSNIN